jgi:hypothetical protein
MRSCTNDAVFDDTLPASDRLLEAGFRVHCRSYKLRWQSDSGARAI